MSFDLGFAFSFSAFIKWLMQLFFCSIYVIDNKIEFYKQQYELILENFGFNSFLRWSFADKRASTQQGRNSVESSFFEFFRKSGSCRELKVCLLQRFSL